MPRSFQWSSLFRYRLKTLIWFITAVAIGLGVWRHWIEQPYVRQQDALDALHARKLGERVEFQERGPRWLPGWVARRLRRVISLHCEQRPVRDDDLEHIGQLIHLERLYRARTQITDAGLEHLAGLNKLRRVSLWGTKITDDGLRHLSTWRHIEAIDIHETKATPACLASLKPDRLMTRLCFSFDLGDEGLANLARLTDRMPGGLSCRHVTSAGLVHLASFRPGLTNLHVYSSRIDADAARAIAQVKGLAKLFVAKGEVSGAALVELRRSPTLQEVVCYQAEMCPAEAIRGLAPELIDATVSGSHLVLRFDAPALTISIQRSPLLPPFLHEFGQATQLRRLAVYNQREGEDTARVNFSGLANLRTLMWVLPLHSSHLDQIGKLTELQSLTIRLDSGCPLEAIDSLCALSKLEKLTLGDSQLTDAHLERLRSLRNLQQLTLYRSPDITDAGLRALHGMPKLKRVELIGTQQSTPEGRARLQATLPRGAQVVSDTRL